MKLNNESLKLYVNGMGFQAIERFTGVDHTTIIYWVKQIGQQLPDAPQEDEIPQVRGLDELETFVGSKKQNLVVDSGKSFSRRNFGLGAGTTTSAETFQPLWEESLLLAVLFLCHIWM